MLYLRVCYIYFSFREWQAHRSQRSNKEMTPLSSNSVTQWVQWKLLLSVCRMSSLNSIVNSKKEKKIQKKKNLSMDTANSFLGRGMASRVTSHSNHWLASCNSSEKMGSIDFTIALFIICICLVRAESFFSLSYSWWKVNRLSFV